MREPKPFFRAQTQSWYVQFGKEQISLGADEKEAFDEYHRLMDERRRGVVRADDSVANILNRHLDYAKKHRAKATFDKKLRHLKSFGRYVGPKLKVSKLKPYHVQSWLDEAYPSCSDTYRHMAASEAQTAINWAVKEGYIGKNPIAQLPNKPQPAIREFILPASRWPELMEAITDKAFKDYITV